MNAGDPIKCSVTRLRRRNGDAFIIRLSQDVDIQLCVKELAEIEDLLGYLNVRLPEILIKRLSPDGQIRRDSMAEFVNWRERVGYFSGRWKNRINYMANVYMFSENPSYDDLTVLLNFADVVTSVTACCLNVQDSIQPGSVLKPLTFPNFGIARTRYRCLLQYASKAEETEARHHLIPDARQSRPLSTLH